MPDLINVLKKIKEEAQTLPGDQWLNDRPKLIRLIEDALKDPELRITVPKGEFVVGVTHNDPEATQAYICLDNDDLGLVDLALCECVEKSLRYKDEEEGTIRLRMWGDIGNEDYTIAHNITAAEIDEQIRYIKD